MHINGWESRSDGMDDACERAPAVASRLDNYRLVGHLGFAPQAITCHRFAVRGQMQRFVVTDRKNVSKRKPWPPVGTVQPDARAFRMI